MSGTITRVGHACDLTGLIDGGREAVGRTSRPERPEVAESRVGEYAAGCVLADGYDERMVGTHPGGAVGTQDPGIADGDLVRVINARHIGLQVQDLRSAEGPGRRRARTPDVADLKGRTIIPGGHPSKWTVAEKFVPIADQRALMIPGDRRGEVDSRGCRVWPAVMI